MSLKKEATSGLVWTFTQQFGAQIISFIVSLVLARLLLPKEFGLIGMIAVFIAVGGALVDSGLTQSLIRSKQLDQEDFSTVFYFNLAASILIYIIVYLTAPLVTNFYDQPLLTPILRLYCTTFIITAFSAVQVARLTQKMDFKTQTLVAIPSIIVGGIVGIVMAYMGYGVWSLVWNQIVTALISTVQLWIYSKWSPSWVFNFEKFKEHFNFGYKLTLSALLNKIFINIYVIIIGRYFSASQVGFYTRADTMKQLPVSNISTALNKVTYPLFAKIQDDDVRLKRVYSQLMQMVVFVIAPTLVFLAVLAEPTFRFLFTKKWLPAVPYFQILCISGVLYPIHAYNLNILKVKGRSDLFLKLAVIKKSITVVGIIIGVQFGIYGLLYAQVALSGFSFFINAFYTNRFINYSAWQQIRDILPIIGLALACGGIVWYLDKFLYGQIDLFRLVAGGITGGVFYILFSYLLRFESLIEFRKIIFKK
ncbi:lipopolysaccharide biosynthesis protein [Salegentibacter maritimus]|uniref:lipopolysaccharide biosynthesis protein n=1 Tax=Salegentibacter maritimus TaxID=2794347 RepID=UPI0018E48B73|nr:lipopolysaccharide biosynthesis protein [Salegentibacter maritimus]MBI6117353.1 lipopolysaccharide biosynthesis protein [Salegentibacter maritimus]